MKTTKIIIWALLIICFVLLGIIMFRPRPVPPPTESNLKQLEFQNNWLLRYNLVLDAKYRKLLVESDSLKDFILIDNQHINELKKRRNEKVRTIDTFKFPELYKYFSEFETESSINR